MSLSCEKLQEMEFAHKDKKRVKNDIETNQDVSDAARDADNVESNVDHPKHYTNLGAMCLCGRPIECIDVTRHMNFNLGNAIKYIWRCDLKDYAIENLQKAIWYLCDEIEKRKFGRM